MDAFPKFILQVIRFVWSSILFIPGIEYLINYFKTSYHNDPIRIILEGILILFTIKYLKNKKTEKPKENLEESEINALIDEWQPEPLVSEELPPLVSFNLETINPITSEIGIYVCCEKLPPQQKALNLVSFNPLGILNLPELKEISSSAIIKYGVGTCGPPGFYGTLDIHLELEKALSNFLGTEAAILYAQNFSALSSVIPAFSKRGDILICDDGINFPLQKGVQISRSNIFYFSHNDMDDLEKVLLEVNHLFKRKPLTRRFIVTEGLFWKYGDISPLPEIIALKKKYKYRLILDETLSIGSFGKRGAGLSDHYSDKVKVGEIDMIIGSLGHAFGACGGFCAGTIITIDHQRLGSQSYCFSASLPALLTSFALAAVQNMPTLEEVLDKKDASTISLKGKIKKALDQLPKNSLFVSKGLQERLPLNFKVKPTNFHSPLIYLETTSDSEKNRDFYKEAQLLQIVVDKALERNLYLSRSKEIYSEDVNILPPSIKICISGAFTNKQLEDIVDGIVDACEYANSKVCQKYIAEACIESSFIEPIEPIASMVEIKQHL